jgi:hypothetical protein
MLKWRSKAHKRCKYSVFWPPNWILAPLPNSCPPIKSNDLAKYSVKIIALVIDAIKITGSEAAQRGGFHSLKFPTGTRTNDGLALQSAALLSVHHRPLLSRSFK